MNRNPKDSQDRIKIQRPSFGPEKICVIGNLLGHNKGYVTTQGQILAEMLAADGVEVISSSSKINRVTRLIDIVSTLVRRKKDIGVTVLEVYSGLSFVMTEVVSRVGRILGFPMIFVLHGGNLPDFSTRYPSWTRRVLARADVLVAPSRFLARNFEAMGFDVEVIRNIVAVDDYPCRIRQQIEPNLIWMRAFHAIYNPQMAVRVLSSVRRKHPQATLVLAGVDKGLQSEIKDLAKELGLNGSVKFPGFLDHEAKVDQFSRADIFLNTNKIDNTPVAIIEAEAMGLPVIATCVGGVPDLVTNGSNGILVPDNDVEGMADAISSLLDDPALTESLSRNGRQDAELSSWEAVRTSWQSIFSRVARRPSKA